MTDHEKYRTHSHENIYSQDKAPAVFSDSIKVSLTKGLTQSELIRLLTEWMEAVRLWAKENHYFIGHIKSFTEDGAGLKLWIATTGSRINIQNSDIDNASAINSITINITAIVYGTDADSLQKIINKNLQRYNLKYISA
jgi:hypothetical protein